MDPFYPVRHFWESLRVAFYNAVSASWILCLDESMVKWQGRGMPGLMVILRKPTPVGLELHTVCCALSGILVNFEVYEGKTAMESFKWCPKSKGKEMKYPKAVALTLRLSEPWHGRGKVFICDSWFGSVICAIALWMHGVFSIMNVKHATKLYPKEELLEYVGEIKGNSEEARQQRRARRGRSLAFSQQLKAGGKTLTLLAAGNNKKVPLLLISTASTMLPAEEHKKSWRVLKADGTYEVRTLTTAQTQVGVYYE